MESFQTFIYGQLTGDTILRKDTVVGQVAYIALPADTPGNTKPEALSKKPVRFGIGAARWLTRRGAVFPLFVWAVTENY